jgi:hypothetical protein
LAEDAAAHIAAALNGEAGGIPSAQAGSDDAKTEKTSEGRADG